MLRQVNSSFIQAVFSFEATLPRQSYCISSNLPHRWDRPLTPLWLAVEGIQFLKTDQLTMRFAIIAVSRSFIWNQFNSKKQQHCKKAFSFLILDNIWASRGFFLPHMEARALTAAEIHSATSALLYVTAQYGSIFEKQSFNYKRASLRAEFVSNSLSLF